MILLERFLKYVAIDTQSDPASKNYPSSEGQVKCLKMLAEEMRGLGLTEVEVEAQGYAMGTIPASTGCEGAPIIGFLAHVDTSPEVSGRDVKPQIIHKDGDTIITSDGTTLLGADDKAGVAIIMTFAEELLKNPATRHGKIRIAFTSDEEIGRGTDFFDVGKFGADYAYTVDGGEEGTFECENFNAASARVEFAGHNVHPGYALNKMVNALHLAMRFDARLPADERPATTSGRDGFYHLTALGGTVEHATSEYIVRDFERAGLEKRKEIMRAAAEKTGAKITIRDTYYNMREVLEQHPEVTQKALAAIRSTGIEPIVTPIRGGTDGARLSFMGLPCPNIFTGGANFHSTAEYCSLNAMHRAVEVLLHICQPDVDSPEK